MNKTSHGKHPMDETRRLRESIIKALVKKKTVR